MKLLDWLLGKPYTLVDHHVSQSGNMVKLQAVIKARRKPQAPVNVHIEIHDDNGQPISKHQDRGVTIRKGETHTIEWDWPVRQNLPSKTLVMKVGVWDENYANCLAWFSPKTWVVK